MGGQSTKVSASLYDDPKNQEATNSINKIAKQIEDYLNKYYELFPQQLNGDTIEYNNFQFYLDVKVD